MPQPIGYVAFVLHAHFPYLRQAGRWPHGEEALHEALAEAYLPLLATLSDLSEGGLPLRLTLAISPILLEQLADPVVQKHARLTFEQSLRRAQEDLRRWEQAGEGHLAYLARFYVDWWERTLQTFDSRFGRNLVGGFRGLVEHGVVELLTGPATHYYLPPQGDLSLMWAQIEVGTATTLRHLGPPVGIWLPELCYRRRLLEHLGELGLPILILDGAGDQPTAGLRPAWADQQHMIAGLPRNQRSLDQVLSAGLGYPGDFLYREFYRRDGQSGLHYWRVTGSETPIERKDYYDPYHALSRSQEHARHYVEQVESQLREFAATSQQPGLLVAALDAELFGHGWFEGATWLRLVLQQLATHPAIGLTTTAAYLHRYPPQDMALPPEALASWDGPQLGGHWDRLALAIQRLQALVQANPSAEGDRERCLNQAARELLLASSSDWPTLIATGRAPAYGQRRFEEHMSRFAQMVELSQADRLTQQEEQLLAEIEELDNPFPYLNYRMFRSP